MAVNVNAVLTRNFTSTATEWEATVAGDLPASASRLFLLLTMRAYDAGANRALTPRWNGAFFPTAASSLLLTITQQEDFHYWFGQLPSPSLAGKNLQINSNGPIRGMLATLFFVDGADDTTPFQIHDFQDRDALGNSVILNGTPARAGSLMISATGIHTPTTVASFSPSGWSTAWSASSTGGGNQTTAIRYAQAGSTDAIETATQFGVSDVNRGGVLIEVQTAVAAGLGLSESVTPGDSCGAPIVAVEVGLTESVTPGDLTSALIPGDTTPENPAGVWTGAAASWKLPSGIDSKGQNSLTVSGLRAATIKGPGATFITTLPPTGWESFTPLNVGTGGVFLLRNDTNYLIAGQSITQSLRLRGGRKVVVMGLTATISRSDWTTVGSSVTCGVMLDENPSSATADGGPPLADRAFHCEGMLFQGSSLTQGVLMSCPTAHVTLVNVHCKKIAFDSCDHRDGTNGKTLNHPDLIQPDGGVKSITIDGFTGYSAYQGLFLKEDVNPQGGPVFLRRVDIHGVSHVGSDGITYSGNKLLWSHAASNLPLTLESGTVWVEGHPHNGYQDATFYRERYWNGSAYVLEPSPANAADRDACDPKPTIQGADALGTYATYSQPHISGRVYLGAHAEYVPAASVGASYSYAARGTGSYARRTAPGIGSSNNLSPEFWCRPTRFGHLFYLGPRTSGTNIARIWIDDNGAWNMLRTVGAATQTAKTANGAATLGSTYHVVGVFASGQNHRLIINGEVLELTFTGAAVTGAFSIGSDDEVAIGNPTSGLDHPDVPWFVLPIRSGRASASGTSFWYDRPGDPISAATRFASEEADVARLDGCAGSSKGSDRGNVSTWNRLIGGAVGGGLDDTDTQLDWRASTFFGFGNGLDWLPKGPSFPDGSGWLWWVMQTIPASATTDLDDGGSAAVWDEIIAGGRDAEYIKLGERFTQKVDASGHPRKRFIVDANHEMNQSNNYRVYAGTRAKYKAAMERTIDKFREGAGWNVRFCHRPAYRSEGAAVGAYASYVPANVDVLSLSIHPGAAVDTSGKIDQLFAGTLNSAWYGTDELLATATAMNLPVAFPEWSPKFEAGDCCPVANTFITKFFNNVIVPNRARMVFDGIYHQNVRDTGAYEGTDTAGKTQWSSMVATRKTLWSGTKS